uniref:Uncharacterized protein n=1 Tax=Anopheles albimanus TaxID=7167 RepID=A0A182FX82_ANOAL
MLLPGGRDGLELLYAFQRVRFGVEEIMIAGSQNQPAGIVRVEMQRRPWLPAGKPTPPPAAIVVAFLIVTNFFIVWIHITQDFVSQAAASTDVLLLLMIIDTMLVLLLLRMMVTG